MSKKTKLILQKLKSVKIYLEDVIGSTTITNELQLSDEKRVLL